jgi:hypothetical protein
MILTFYSFEKSNIKNSSCLTIYFVPLKTGVFENAPVMGKIKSITESDHEYEVPPNQDKNFRGDNNLRYTLCEKEKLLSVR